ncbi:protein kinase domain-containing protein [Ostreiculturibacter nitratireducens]|uniref:protein kinase domain-containing protein n=1 Tax=Ostreiculturibacter nitratireducens TaxID=3075226 RepID=UPI0031B574F6
MALEDEQLKWLEAATAGKHRFKRRSITKEFEAYKRRREKAATARDLLAPSDPNVAIIDAGLKAADDEAAKGKFKEAYAALDDIKRIAKASAAGRSDGVIADDLKMHANILESQVALHKQRVDSLEARTNALLDEARRNDPVRNQPTFEAALVAREAFIAVEARMRSDQSALFNEANSFADRMDGHDLKGRVATAETLAAALQKTGRDTGIAGDVARVTAAKQQLAAAAGRYATGDFLRKMGSDARTALFETLANIRSLETYQKRDGEGTTQDAKTETIRGKLKPTDNRLALIEAEQERLEKAIGTVTLATTLDDLTLLDTSRQKINTLPERPKFDMDNVVGGLQPIAPANPDGTRGHVSLRAIETTKAEALANLRQATRAIMADPDRLFDLTLKRAEDFRKSLAAELLPGVRSKDMTENEKLLLADVAAELEKEVCKVSPNKVAADGQTLDMGGTVYRADAVLGQGGFGRAQRFVDPQTGKAVVVKTLLSNEPEKRKNMVEEMEVHYRLMQGMVPGQESAIVEMKGAARSDDGSFHMIMEEIEGGELDDEANLVNAMERSGLIPESARELLVADMLKNTVEGLMELERLGFAHNDMKGGNVMMTKDGKIKVIDYGSSRFGDDEGKLKPGRWASTPQYDPMDSEVSSKSDEFALGVMIRKMVGQLSPQRWASKNIKFDDRGQLPDAMKDDPDKRKFSGALGALLSAVENEKPDERPSYEALLASTVLMRDSEDVNPEDVKDLRAASLQMAEQMRGMKVDVDFDGIQAKVANNKRFEGVDIRELLAKQADLTGNDVKLKEAQAIVGSLDETIRSAYANMADEKNENVLKSEKKKITEAMLAREVLIASVINPGIEARSEDGKREYQAAIADPNIQVAYKGANGPATLSIGEAVKRRESILAKLSDIRDRFYKFISQAEGVNMDKVEQLNEMMTKLDDECRSIEAAVYGTVGPDAKFYLARTKVAEVGARFGTANTSSTHTPPERDVVDEITSTILKGREAAGIEKAAT